MALTVEEVEAILRLKDELSDKLNQAKGNLESFGDQALKVGAGLTAALTLPIVGVGGAALKMAVDAVESENLFEVSFEGMAQSAREWSEDLNQRLGLNQYELRRTSGMLYTMFQSMGLGKDAAFDMSTGLSELAADMASFYNLRPEEAFQKLRAGIVGETEPLKALGILVDENTTKTTAYTSGIARQGEELTQQQKVLARYRAIMDQTSKAQGDLARTIDSPTNQLRLMKEQMNETMIELGNALLPTFTEFLNLLKAGVPYIQGIVKGFGAMPGPVKAIAIGFVGLAAAAGPVLLLIGSAMKAAAGIGIKSAVDMTGALKTLSGQQVATTATTRALTMATQGLIVAGAVAYLISEGKALADKARAAQEAYNKNKSLENAQALVNARIEQSTSKTALLVDGMRTWYGWIRDIAGGLPAVGNELAALYQKGKDIHLISGPLDKLRTGLAYVPKSADEARRELEAFSGKGLDPLTQKLRGFEMEMDRIKQSGGMPALKKALDEGRLSVDELAGAFGVSKEAMEDYTKRMKNAKEESKDARTEFQRMVDTLSGKEAQKEANQLNRVFETLKKEGKLSASAVKEITKNAVELQSQGATLSPALADLARKFYETSINASAVTGAGGALKEFLASLPDLALPAGDAVGAFSEQLRKLAANSQADRTAIQKTIKDLGFENIKLEAPKLPETPWKEYKRMISGVFYDVENSFARTLLGMGNRTHEEHKRQAEDAKANYEQVQREQQQILVETQERARTEFDRTEKSARANFAGIEADARARYKGMVESGQYTKEELEEAWKEMNIYLKAESDRTDGEIEAARKIMLEEIEGAERDTNAEIARAHQEMLDAKEAASHRWKDNMKDLWNEFKGNFASVLTDMLGDFEHRFIVGMIRGLTGAKGGFTSAFTDLLHLGGSAGAGGAGAGAAGAGNAGWFASMGSASGAAWATAFGWAALGVAAGWGIWKLFHLQGAPQTLTPEQQAYNDTLDPGDPNRITPAEDINNPFRDMDPNSPEYQKLVDEGVIPRMAIGGEIRETGLALVHKGETVVPADVKQPYEEDGTYGQSMDDMLLALRDIQRLLRGLPTQISSAVVLAQR